MRIDRLVLVIGNLLLYLLRKYVVWVHRVESWVLTVSKFVEWVGNWMRREEKERWEGLTWLDHTLDLLVVVELMPLKTSREIAEMNKSGEKEERERCTSERWGEKPLPLSSSLSLSHLITTTMTPLPPPPHPFLLSLLPFLFSPDSLQIPPQLLSNATIQAIHYLSLNEQDERYYTLGTKDSEVELARREIVECT